MVVVLMLNMSLKEEYSYVDVVIDDVYVLLVFKLAYAPCKLGLRKVVGMDSGVEVDPLEQLFLLLGELRLLEGLVGLKG